MLPGAPEPEVAPSGLSPDGNVVLLGTDADAVLLETDDDALFSLQAGPRRNLIEGCK